MSTAAVLQFAAFAVLIAVSTPLLGVYMYRVYFTKQATGDRIFLPIERFIYRLCGIDPAGEQRWTAYAGSLLLFSLVSLLVTYALLRLQTLLPLNPDHQGVVSPGLSFNTAISFHTGTNWQSYAGERTMSQLSQILALVTQQFIAGAIGMAVVVALIRGLIRRRHATLGNFWVDTVRSITRILLPISFVFALVLVSQGVIQNFHGSQPVKTVAVQGVKTDGAAIHNQTLPGGPVASMTTIELVGNNGGGYFNVS